MLGLGTKLPQAAQRDQKKKKKTQRHLIVLEDKIIFPVKWQKLQQSFEERNN